MMMMVTIPVAKKGDQIDGISFFGIISLFLSSKKILPWSDKVANTVSEV